MLLTAILAVTQGAALAAAAALALMALAGAGNGKVIYYFRVAQPEARHVVNFFCGAPRP